MKRLYYSIILAVAAFAIQSCTNETIGISEGTEAEVTFSMNVEGSQDTKAISDGKSVDKLIYAIVTTEGEVVGRSEKVLDKSFSSSLELTMTVTMVKGITYKAVFWAQSSKCNAYTMSDDMTVTVDYSGVNNDESRDAFYGVSSPFTLAERNAEVVLKRPFAQFNAGTHPFDWEYAASHHNFKATKSAVKIRNVANEINLWNGEVSGSVDASFSPGTLPSEKLLADVDLDGKKEEYVYLSMSYILAGTEASRHSVDLYMIDKNNRAVMAENSGLTKVELSRNRQTDFVGQVLTDDGMLNPRNYNELQTIYYNIAQDSVISDQIYNMHGFDAIQFASVNKQKFTLNNIYFTGDIWTIELGEYRGSSYVKYENELNNVVMKDLVTTVAIECHEWYFAPAVIAYGKSVLNNCTMTGTVTTREPITDKHGIAHEVIPADIGVRNESDAVINGGTYGTFFAWTHAVVDIYGATIGTLYCGTCDSTKHSWMTIHSGTKIDQVICCEPRCPYGTKEYSTTMTIKSGAEIGSLQLVSTDVEFLIIEEGAKVGKITCEGVEYTYQELRAAMGL